MPYERIWDDEPGSRWVDTGAAYRDHDADYMQAESEREIMASAFVSDEEFDADPVNSGADIVDDGDDNRMLPEEHSQVTGWDSRPLPPRRNRAPHAAHLRSKPGISSALAASKSSPRMRYQDAEILRSAFAPSADQPRRQMPPKQNHDFAPADMLDEMDIADAPWDDRPRNPYGR